MKTLLIVLFLSTITNSFGGVDLLIEKENHPSGQTETYKVSCTKKCGDQLIAKFNELLSTPLPADKKLSGREVLYSIKATDGKTKRNFKVGYATSYEDKEFEKYAKVISIISDLRPFMEKSEK